MEIISLWIDLKMTKIRFYRIYDAGMAIDLDGLEAAFAEKYDTSRARFRRIRPKSIVMDTSPLVLNMGQIPVEAGNSS
jgi:hypothetical protein